MRLRTSWLHAGALGDFQRIRRVQSQGDLAGAHTLTVKLYYDERPFWEESVNYDFTGPASVATDGFGGSGSWGDPGGFPMRDDLWRWSRRCARQKCSVISVELSDNGADSGGFTATFVALELGRRSQLDRYGRPSPSTSSTPGSRGGPTNNRS